MADNAVGLHMALMNKLTIDSALKGLVLCLLVGVGFLIPFHENVPELSAAIFFFSIVHLWRSGKIDLEPLKQFDIVLIAGAIFILWVVLRSLSFFSVVEFKNIFRYTGIFYIPILIWLSSDVLSAPRRFDLIICSFLSANVIIACYSIVAAIFSGQYFDISFMGLFPHHWFPGVLAFAIPISTCLLISARTGKVAKLLLSISLVLFLVCIYMASRRGIILSVICSLGVIALYIVFSLKTKKYIVISMVLIAVFSLMMISNPRFKAINKAYTGYRYDIRLTMWKTAVEMAAEHPSRFLFGHGLDKGFAEYNSRLRDIEFFPEFMKEKHNSSHNDFVDLFIIFGGTGLLLFVALLLALLRHAVRTRNIILLSMLAMAIPQFIFGSHYFWFRSGKYLFFFLLSLFLAMNVNIEAKNEPAGDQNG